LQFAQFELRWVYVLYAYVWGLKVISQVPLFDMQFVIQARGLWSLSVGYIILANH